VKWLKTDGRGPEVKREEEGKRSFWFAAGKIWSEEGARSWDFWLRPEGDEQGAG